MVSSTANGGPSRKASTNSWRSPTPRSFQPISIKGISPIHRTARVLHPVRARLSKV